MNMVLAYGRRSQGYMIIYYDNLQEFFVKAYSYKSQNNWVFSFANIVDYMLHIYKYIDFTNKSYAQQMRFIELDENFKDGKTFKEFFGEDAYNTWSKIAVKFEI